MAENEMENKGFTRRTFLKAGTVAGAAAIASGALAACAPAKTREGGDSGGQAAAPAAEDEHIGAGRRATATLANAEPIPPIDPPASWDAEADIIIVGAGGGGINGALVARDAGASVIVVEKQDIAGGATAHANGYLNISGTGKAQKEMEFGYPAGNFPLDMKKFMAEMQNQFQYSIDNRLIEALANKGGEVADWMTEKGAEWLCIGPFYVSTSGLENSVQGMRQLTDQFWKLGEEAGAEYHLNTECKGLVYDGERVVGIQVQDDQDQIKFYKANKAVVLCAGGFGMNPDLIKKYIPTAYERIVYGGPFPAHTGDALRMALGLGADIAGFDSWSCWECAPDNGTGDWNYFYGFRQIMQMPWLNFDCEGKRADFYDDRLPGMPPYVGGLGDTLRVAVQMSRPRGRVYAIFDSDYEKNFDKIKADMGERKPITPEDGVRDTGGLFDTDWHVEWDKALEDGRLKKADTLEELAEMLDLDPDIVNDVVTRWNDNCKKGKDDDPDILYPYLPEWLNPIQKAPFYGAALGGQLGKTLAGVRVNHKLQVMKDDGHKIPGLYAGFTTAGGVVGETNYGGGLVNTSLLGGCALSWTSGYYAVQCALEEE